MATVDTSNLERIESSRDRLRRWFEDVVVFFGLAAVGWFIGDSLLTLTSKGGWVAGVVAVGLAAVAFLWFWWSAWTRRAKLFGAGLLLLAIAVPLVNHYA